MNVDHLLQLQQPLKEGGIRSVNFFNGRLLTSKDLSREQVARRESDARLGLALGSGVAFGLEVKRDTTLDTVAAPVLRVKAGLAINRMGHTLRLTADTSVALTRMFSATGSATERNCVFANCNPIADGVYVARAGVYVLMIAPAQASEGRAPTNGLDPTNVHCNTDATIEALQFRLLAINPLRYADLDISSPQFRNRLAYRCFGSEARELNVRDPLREDLASYGLVDELRMPAGRLSDCDVPLALLYWTADGLRFVDTWAVRRRLVEPDALTGSMFQAKARRIAEADAMCSQFQQHLDDLLAASPSPASIAATGHFRYLPPFGIVPIQAPPLRGFVDAVFFAGVVRRPVPGSTQGTEFIDGRLLCALRNEALQHTFTDVTQKEFIWVYRPWQITQTIDRKQTAQPMLAFASGLMSNLATSKFDMARFDYSNYASCCGNR